MLKEKGEEWIGEFVASQHFLFAEPSMQPHAENILHALFSAAVARGCQDIPSFKAKLLESVIMEDLVHLSLPVEIRKGIPLLIQGFADFLQQTGRHPGAGAWSLCAEAMSRKFIEKIRDDGTVRGETIRKKAAPVGRNDPCPCGSGQKYKKCCGPLESLLSS